MSSIEITTAPAGETRESAAAGFCFLDPGLLVDGELELVAPSEQWVDDVLRSCRHPMTVQHDREHARLTRLQIEEFLRLVPDGHEPADAQKHRAPTYHFWMHLDPASRPLVPMAGSISLRVGQNLDLELHYGHIGYNVYPPARGRHYAERACRLLFGLARRHGINPLWITANPENLASRRTCERLGGQLIDTVNVPWGHPLHTSGQRHKCRYLIEI